MTQDDKSLLDDYPSVAAFSAHVSPGVSARFFDIPAAAIEQAASRQSESKG